MRASVRKIELFSARSRREVELFSGRSSSRASERKGSGTLRREEQKGSGTLQREERLTLLARTRSSSVFWAATETSSRCVSRNSPSRRDASDLCSERSDSSFWQVNSRCTTETKIIIIIYIFIYWQKMTTQ